MLAEPARIRINRSVDRGDDLFGASRRAGQNAVWPHARPCAENRAVQIGLMSASMLDRPWDEMLDAMAAQGVCWVEACGGGHIPTRHFDPVALVRDGDARARFVASLRERELRLSSLSCHGNPLHPEESRADSDRAALAAMCRLAPDLGVTHVNVLAGLPAAAPSDRAPNWIVNSVFPGLDDAYRWQWEERVLPYWRAAAATAEDAGVVLCVEPHPSDVVYSPATFRRLREEVGPAIGMNFDPSHLWWQGIDPLEVIAECGVDIKTCHIKDLQLHDQRIRRDGVLSPKPYERWDERPWTFSTPGYGHSELFWAQLVIALRRAGYAGVLSIECEDPFLTPDDTFAASVALLNRILPADAPPPVDWAANAAFADPTHAAHD
jgi:sugar phosphate isomerase/epimerase